MIRVENDLDPAEDIYTIGYQVLDRFDQNEQRQIIKGLVLNLLNADNIDGAYSAYRQRNVTNKFGKITNDQCNKLVDAIKKLQPELADNFGKDRGVDLMFKDSQVIEQIIILATTNDIPVLTVHDSVICRERDEEALRSFMKIATYKILSTQLSFDINRTSMMRTVQSTQQEDKKLFERLYHDALKQDYKTNNISYKTLGKVPNLYRRQQEQTEQQLNVVIRTTHLSNSISRIYILR